MGPTRQRTSRRVLRAVFAADLAGFSGQVAVDETAALHSFSKIRDIALEQLNTHDGWLFGMPGDGIFALFESAIDAVKCGLGMQGALAKRPELDTMRMRIGIHLGEVLFDRDLPFGEALAIAARLESLAQPGSILVSQNVFDAVSSRIAARFEPRGVPKLKNIPRRIETYAVMAMDVSRRGGDTAGATPGPSGGAGSGADLDQTTTIDLNLLRQLREGHLGEAVRELEASRSGAGVGGAPARARDLTELAQRLSREHFGAPAAPERQSAAPAPPQPARTGGLTQRIAEDAARRQSEALGVDPADQSANRAPVTRDATATAPIAFDEDPVDLAALSRMMPPEPINDDDIDPALLPRMPGDPVPSEPGPRDKPRGGGGDGRAGGALPDSYEGLKGIIVTPRLQALIVEALAIHVGPVAKVMVERRIKQASSLDDLIGLLEKDIASSDERMAFRTRASFIVLNH